MVYFNSVINLRPDQLYKAKIRYSYFYFYITEVSETFKTLGEAKQWILEQRCPDHKELVEEESEEVIQEECEISDITGNAFDEESDDDKPLVSDSSDSLEELKKKTMIQGCHRKPKKWVTFK